jgi:glycerol kinase
VDGIPGGLPLSGVAGDQQAALFGQACFAPGDVKNSYGTGSFVLMNVGGECPPPVDGLLTTIAWDLPAAVAGKLPPKAYAFEGSIFITGAAVQWLRDGLEVINDAAETEELASRVDDSGGVVVVPAFTGLGSPFWDPEARGTICGITRGTTAAHIARAVVESMACSTRDVVEVMTATSGREISVLKADGGASAMQLLLQLQADQLGVKVARPKTQESTALGAAFLAGLAEGVWTSLDDVADRWEVDAEAYPAGDRSDSDAIHAQWRRGIDRSRGWAAF